MFLFSRKQNKTILKSSMLIFPQTEFEIMKNLEKFFKKLEKKLVFSPNITFKKLVLKRTFSLISTLKIFFAVLKNLISI